MVGNTFFGNFDLASAAIWLFWLFFALLIFYLQTENMREGYALEDDDGNIAPNQGPFPVPNDKTFILRDGRGNLTQGNTRLIPMNFAKIKGDRVVIRSLHAHNVMGIPTIKKAGSITLLEEEKVMAYFGGGTLYADPKRAEPLI